jgi:hypothetical protein
VGKSRCLKGLDRGSGGMGDHHHVCFDYKFPKPCELARCHNAGDRHGLNVVLGVLSLHPSSNTLERR